MGRSSRRRAASRARSNQGSAGTAVPLRQGAALGLGSCEPDVAPPTVATLADLVDAVERRQQADVEIEVLVDLLVARGMSWGDVGRALGISRQGARQRYGRR